MTDPREAFMSELKAGIEKSLKAGPLNREQTGKVVKALTLDLLEKHGLEIEEYWYCHDCKRDQPVVEKLEVVPRADESVGHRVLPTMDVVIHRLCKVCGGNKLGLYISGTVEA